jgi:uncharacterized iron-regulated membrane protein
VAKPSDPRTSGDVVIQWFGPLHTGNFGGTIIKSLYVVVGLAPALLFITGFVIWWQRVISRRWRSLTGRSLTEATPAAPESGRARPANT